MMIVAVAAGVLFYLGLIVFHSREAPFALQLFNAVFIGIVAGIGMLWFRGLNAGKGRLCHYALYQQHFNGRYSGRGDSGGVVANLRPRVSVLDDCGHFRGDAGANLPGKRCVILKGGFTK